MWAAVRREALLDSKKAKKPDSSVLYKLQVCCPYYWPVYVQFPGCLKSYIDELLAHKSYHILARFGQFSGQIWRQDTPKTTKQGTA